MLKPKISPKANFIGALCAALFWNGIVSLFVADVIRGFRSGHPEWFLTVFMIPFVAIGLGMCVAVFYFLLALFNPRLQLTVTPGAVPLNGSLRVEWHISGRTEVIKRLRLSLAGYEEATYRRGTSTCTDKSVFANLEIAETTATPEMSSGTKTINVPSDLMHSFSSKNNKIIWCIQVHGNIERWPDMNEEFPVTILPLAGRTPEPYE